MKEPTHVLNTSLALLHRCEGEILHSWAKAPAVQNLLGRWRMGHEEFV